MSEFDFYANYKIEAGKNKNGENSFCRVEGIEEDLIAGALIEK